jgi:hypothetical protein
MHRTHLPFDTLAPLPRERRDDVATGGPRVAVRPEARRVPDARTERHRVRAWLREAERGGDPDGLVA